MKSNWQFAAFVMIALLAGIGIILSRILQFGVRVAEMYTPEGVLVPSWQVFITNAAMAMFAVALVFFYLYSVGLYKIVRVDGFNRVFELRRPWIWGLAFAFFTQIAIAVMIGLEAVPDRKFSSIMMVIAFSCLAGAGSVIIYWLFTLIYSPPKVKYAPVFRYELSMLLPKWRGR